MSTAKVCRTLYTQQIRIFAIPALKDCNQADDCIGRNYKCSIEYLLQNYIPRQSGKFIFIKHFASCKLLLLRAHSNHTLKPTMQKTCSHQRKAPNMHTHIAAVSSYGKGERPCKDKSFCWNIAVAKDFPPFVAAKEFQLSHLTLRISNGFSR